MWSLAALVGVIALVLILLLYGLFRRAGEPEVDDATGEPVKLPEPAPARATTRVPALPAGPGPRGPAAGVKSWISLATAARLQGNDVQEFVELCFRRADLLAAGARDPAVFEQLGTEITHDLLTEDPAPESAADHLQDLVSSFERVVRKWVDPPRTSMSGRRAGIQDLARLLAFCGVTQNAPSPLREYLLIAEASAASATVSTSHLHSATTRYVDAQSQAEAEGLSRYLLAFWKVVGRYAQNVSQQLAGYEQLTDRNVKLGHVTTLLKFLEDLQQAAIAEELPAFERQLCAHLLTESRELLMSEYRAVRGRPAWSVSLSASPQLELGSAVPPQLHLTLLDRKNVRPRRVTLTIPATVAPPDGIDYTVASVEKVFRPQRDTQMTVDVPVSIPEPPHITFPIHLQFPVHVEWEDGGVSDSVNLSAEFDLTCSVRRPKLNPYTDGHGGLALSGDSKLFTGRQDIVGEILKNLQERTATFFVLWGLSRSGKTSVINRIGYQMNQEAIVVPTSGQLEGAVAGGYPRALKAAIQQALVTHRIHLSDKMQQRTRDAKPRAIEDFFFFLNDLEPILREHKKFILITLDEYDKLQLERDRGSDDSTLWLLKTIFDRPTYSRFVRFLAAGTFSLSQLEDHHRPWREVLGGRLVHKRLDLFSYEDVRDLVVRHSAVASLNWPAEMVQCVYSLTAGHPFLTNLLCYWVIEEAYEKSTSLSVDVPLIEYALETWLRETAGGISDLKFCYDEPSSWTSHETQLVQHTLSKLAAAEHASCLRPLPQYTKGQMSDYLRRHYPDLPLAEIDLDAALGDLERREVVRSVEREDGRAYSIRFGILDYALRRSGGLFDHVLRMAGYHH